MASDVVCLCVFLLFSGLQFTTGCQVMLPNIFCAPGESVLLPCRDINSPHSGVQWWYSDPGKLKPEYSVSPVDSIKGQRYKDRVQIHSNLSLSITRLTVDDEGLYWCKTTDTNPSSYIQIHIDGCSLSENEKLEKISRSSGQSVFLFCLVKCSARHKPDSQFIWKLPNDREIKQITELNRLYQGRFRMFDISSGNLSLLISDLNEEDEGLYSCWSNGSNGIQHKNFSLAVKGCTLSESEHKPKTKYVGDSVLLSCSCEDPNTKPRDFRWTHVESSETEVSTETLRYKGRVQMFHKTTPSNLSLLISNLTEEDQGTYRCTINNKTSTNTRLNVKGCTLSETKQEPKTKYVGDSVLLSCSCEDPNTKPRDFRWTHVESSETEVSNETLRYKDRVQMFHKTTPSNLSLLISNLTEEDQGTYRCTINNKTSTNTRLNVKGCTLSETKQEPKTKYVGDSVLLSCSCEDPNTKPRDFRWTHVESSETEVSSETLRYKDRVQMFHKTTPSNLSLLISNLTEEDQGTYRCTINNKTSTNTRLNIKDFGEVRNMIYLINLMMLLVFATAGCVYWIFTRARTERRGSRLIQSSDDEDDTYTSVVYSSSYRPKLSTNEH